MDSTDIIKRVQRTFGDDAGTQVQEEDIIRWINDAQREIAVQAHLLETLASIDFTPDGSLNTVAMPPNLLELTSVHWVDSSNNKTILRRVSFAQAESDYMNSDTSDIPVVYWTFARTIYLWPTPVAAGTVYYYYTREPDEVTNSDTTLVLPVSYHNRIVEYCLKQAYELDENTEMMGAKGQEFTNNLATQANAESQLNPSRYPTVTVDPYDW